MYEPTQEIIVAELRLRGMMQVADIMRLLGPSFASLLPYELQRRKESGLVVYDEPLGLEAVLRLPYREGNRGSTHGQVEPKKTPV